MTTPVFDTDEEGRTVLNSTVAENLEAQWSNHIVSEIARQGQFLEEAMQEQIENHLTSMASAAGETITEAVQEKVDWLDEKLHEYVTEYVPDEMINESVGEEIGRLREQNELLHAAIRVLVENVYSGGDVDAFYAAVRAEVGSHVATAASYQDAVINKSKGSAARNRDSLRPQGGTSNEVNEDGGVRFKREADLVNFATALAPQGAEVLVESDGNVVLENLSPDDRIAKKQVTTGLNMARYMAAADRLPDRN